MAQWVKPDFPRGEVDRAAIALIPWWNNITPPPEHIGQYWHIVDNWRTSHAFPLNTFQMGLRQRARRTEPSAIVAQRLKRISAVMNKLTRQRSMKLSQMNDLGGCRAILSNIDTVYKLLNLYCCGSEEGPRCYDYIKHPKPDGYRGIHVIGRYEPRTTPGESWAGARIEIQLRTRLQHAFATTVETVTTFTRQPLKFGAGSDLWRRFFMLIGSAIALREGAAPVPDTPRDRSELVRELRDATKALRVQQRLRTWAHALKALPRSNIRNFKWLLLRLDVSANTIQVTGYRDRKSVV